MNFRHLFFFHNRTSFFCLFGLNTLKHKFLKIKEGIMKNLIIKKVKAI